MKPTVIDRQSLVLTKEIPEGTKQAVIVTYRDRTLVLPVEMYERGDYRLEFIKHFGIPLPPAPSFVPEYFSPNLKELL